MTGMRTSRARQLGPPRGLCALLVLVAGVVAQQQPERASAASAARCQLLRVTIVGTPGDDLVRGTRGDDVIAGLAGDDRLLGRGGSDRLCGGPGRDVLRGGEGIDRLDPGAGRDRVTGGPDPINVVSYVESPHPIRINLEKETALGWGRDVVRNVHQVEGSRFGDVITGTAQGNALIGLAGGDRLTGGDGDDSLLGGRGNDRLVGGRGADYAAFINSAAPVDVDLAAGSSRGEGRDDLKSLENVFGSPQDDVLAGTNGANEFIGGVSGDDEIVGRRGNDAIFRYYGAGTINGGRGRDTVFYAFPGTIDLPSGTAIGTDFSDSLAGAENVIGAGGRHVIVGDDASNELQGGGGRDAIKGGAADDMISGGGGDDLLTGGDGADEISGGGGEDTCLEGESVSSCEHSLLGVKSDRPMLAEGATSLASWEWTCGPGIPHLVLHPLAECRVGP